MRGNVRRECWTRVSRDVRKECARNLRKCRERQNGTARGKLIGSAECWTRVLRDVNKECVGIVMPDFVPVSVENL